MCRILAVETIPNSSAPFSPKDLLEQFSDACGSDEWNAPDRSKQKDGWGLYAALPDYWGTRSVLTDIVQVTLEKDQAAHCEFQFQLGVWKLYYRSLNEIWSSVEAQWLAQVLPPATQLLVHARAAFKGEGVLSNNQPYLSDDIAYAANLSFSSLEAVSWKKRLKSEYPDWKLNTTHIGAERVFHLLEAILAKEPSLEKALHMLNTQLSTYAEVHGMNIVVMNDQGMAAVCGTHVNSDVGPEEAQYYTLHHGNITQDQKHLKIISSAPFADLQLQPMQMGEVVTTS